MSEKKFVFRNIEDSPFYTVDKCAGGSGRIRNITLLGDEAMMPVPEGQRHLDDSDSFDYVHLTELPVGAWIGEHPHEGNEQFYLIVEGEGEVTLCGETFPVKPWSIAMIKSGGSHGIRNTGNVPLKYLCVQTQLSLQATQAYVGEKLEEFEARKKAMLGLEGDTFAN